MTLSRAAFGVQGNRLPGFLSYLVFVGWETVLVSLATLASETIFTRVGDMDPDLSKIFGFLLAGGLTIIGGVLGFKVIMKIQFFLTITTIGLTAGYISLTIDSVNWARVSAIQNGAIAGFIGAIIFAITGIGLGWVGCAADYSRYLPRTVSGKAVVGWTIFGASIVPIVLVIYGSLLAASSDELNQQVATDPIGALTTLLPTWYLIPFALVAILGLIGGAILDLYSSGLVLVSIGLPIKRHIAASIDGVIMTIGTIYLVWFASDFFVPFQGFLITLGVPVAVWSGLFVADVMLRKSYAEKELFDLNGRYGACNFKSIGLILFGTLIGWGLVTNSLAFWLSWQGYLLTIFGGKEGQWAYANLGVIAALLIGFIGHILLSKEQIKNQESK
jgi:purine-cytosine permease-like protein